MPMVLVQTLRFIDMAYIFLCYISGVMFRASDLEHNRVICNNLGLALSNFPF